MEGAGWHSPVSVRPPGIQTSSLHSECTLKMEGVEAGLATSGGGGLLPCRISFPRSLEGLCQLWLCR